MLFRFTFKIETKLDYETTRELVLNRLKIGSSFVEPAFEDNEFAFSYKKIAPEFYNFSLFGFEGQIIEKEQTTEIKFKAVIEPVLFSIYIIAFVLFLIFYITNFEGVREHPFSNPLFGLLPIIVIYIIYLIKISEVKSLFKRLLLI